jgi:Protein of unknown function DUF262
MDYINTEWTIQKLLELIHTHKLDLCPSYQRNPVWRSSSQTKLIDSIIGGKPLPSFFLRKTGADTFEMVDGQQRARTIVSYWENKIPDEDRKYIEERLKTERDPKAFRESFLNFRLSVTIIENLSQDEKIENYYVLLNNSSLRLNRPELKKAEYYNTLFLELIRSATDYPAFRDLELFDEYSLKRMTDFEAASELIATIKSGLFDKKEKIDVLFEDDISEAEQSQLLEAFAVVIDTLQVFDRIQRIKRTRIRQKADFYSFCYFIHTLAAYSESTKINIYKAFLKVAPHIKPSNSRCEPLREYAHNCVTQSNSKAARTARHEILIELFANPLPTPTQRQRQVFDFFKLPHDSTLRSDGLLLINPAALVDPEQKEFDLNSFLKNDI